MGEIRSSWEIAQEKADKLGDLSSDERTRQREEQYRNVATVLVRQYLDDKDIRPVEKELNRYTGEDRELMTQVILDSLIESIGLNNDFSPELVLRGINAISDKVETGDGVDAIEDIYNEYLESLKVKKRHAEDAGRQMLRDMKISGNAVGRINIYARDEWSDALSNVTVHFKKRLADIGR